MEASDSLRSGKLIPDPDDGASTISVDPLASAPSLKDLIKGKGFSDTQMKNFARAKEILDGSQ